MLQVRVRIWEEKGTNLSIIAKSVKSANLQDTRRLVMVTENSCCAVEQGVITSLTGQVKISVQKRKCAVAWTVLDIPQATFLVEG